MYIYIYKYLIYVYYIISFYTYNLKTQLVGQTFVDLKMYET